MFPISVEDAVQEIMAKGQGSQLAIVNYPGPSRRLESFGHGIRQLSIY